MGHKHGIGPQSLGALGMNPKSTPCGHPRTMGNYGTPINKLEDLSGDGKITQKDVLIGRGVIDADGSPKNYGTEKKTDVTSPMDFNVFENADPRAAVNMMSDMAPTGGGAPAAPTPAPAPAAPNTGGPFGGGLAGGIAGMLKRRAGRTGSGAGALRSLAKRIGRRSGAVAATNNQRERMLSQLGNAGPTVDSPGGGSGGAIASAEAAQASADAANSQMDALKEKLSGIRSQLDSLSGMI
mgnify:CR=1 FL=1